MDVRARRPREPEEGDGEQEATQNSGVEAFLGREVRSIARGATLEGFLAVNEAVDEDEECSGEDAADSDSQEGEAGFTGVEVVDSLEDEGEGVEEAEEDAEVEGGVDGEEGDDGFGEEHAEGAEDGN